MRKKHPLVSPSLGGLLESQGRDILLILSTPPVIPHLREP